MGEEYPQPVPPVFALGAYTYQAETVGDVFTMRAEHVPEMVAAHLGIPIDTHSYDALRDITPADQARIVDAVHDLRDGLALHDYTVNTDQVTNHPQLTHARGREATADAPGPARLSLADRIESEAARRQAGPQPDTSPDDTKQTRSR